MAYKKSLFLAVALVGAASFWTSCSKNDLLTNFKGVTATPDIALPLAKAKFKFADFIKGDSVLRAGADSSVRLVSYQDSVASYAVSDIVGQATGNVGVTFNRNIAVGEIPITVAPVSNSISFSQVIDGVSNVLAQNALRASCGTTNIIPNFSSAAISADLPANTEFETVTFASGSLNIAVANNFPFPISAFTIDLLNGTNNSVITSFNVPLTASGGTQNATANMANITVPNNMKYRVSSITTTGSAGAVAINCNATLNVTVSSSNLKVKSGRIKVPQTVLPAENIVADLSTSNASQRLRKITLQSATASYTITSPSGITMSITLGFPSIIQNGTTYSRNIAVANTNTTGSFNFSNADVDLSTVAGQNYNKLPIQANVTILSSGNNFVNIDATQQVGVSATFGNIQISGAQGQFGTFDIAIPTKTTKFDYDFSFLDATSRRLLFENPYIRLRYSNSFGIPVSANIRVNATGIFGGVDSLGAPTIPINYPNIAQIGQTIRDSFSITPANSNIRNFLAVLPKNISYSGNVRVNSTNPNELHYFTPSSRILLGMEVNIPMRFNTESLIVKDTAEGNIMTDADTRLKDLETATLVIQHNTTFPLTTGMSLVALNGTQSETIVDNFSIPAATPSANGRVTTAAVGTQRLSLTKDQVVKMLKAQKLVVVGRLQTANNGTTPVEVLTTSSFELGLSLEAKIKL